MSKGALHTLHKFQAAQSVTIVALGDSLTYGWNANKGYLDFFKDTLKKRYPESPLTIINSGIPGDTADGGLARLDTDVIRHKPDCVLIQFGLNDAFTGYSVEQFYSNLWALLVKLSEKTDAELILTTSVWFEPLSVYTHALPFYKCIEAIAEDRSLPIVLLHERWKQKNRPRHGSRATRADRWDPPHSRRVSPDGRNYHRGGLHL